MKRNILILLSLICIIGCMPMRPMPTKTQIDKADCGAPPNGYREIIENTIAMHLIDPESARYVFEDIYAKAYSPYVNDYGYAFCGTLNSKNRYGGYVGASPFFAIIKNGQVITLISEAVCIPDTYELGQKVALKRISKSMSYCR